ncbi:hypothetical protein CR532_04545 (plasmid) [Candidatus Borreliella tachyglossi]|uniref:Uncharacterized protein n=1 Tax=Candidatus Borreliella tachyglossi TaxID=1964448 RepID=A0A2S1LY95_9SPIR|nr:hypothetical protein [Candidatus Borreliella tachyglossi]AWG43269.1 hypothetical protein CR532_04545 [Candidatus Borreliella tachyglossi]
MYTHLTSKIILLSILLICSLNLFANTSESNELRVKDWETNFDAFKKSTDRLKYIEDLKSLSEEDFLGKLGLSLMLTRSYMDIKVPAEHTDLFNKASKFLTTLRNQNADKAGYLICELESLGFLLADIKETAATLTYDELDEVKKHYHEYKEPLETLLPLIPQHVDAFFSTLHLLDPENMENSFNTFMVKFVELFNSSTKLYSTLASIHAKYILKK